MSNSKSKRLKFQSGSRCCNYVVMTDRRKIINILPGCWFFLLSHTDFRHYLRIGTVMLNCGQVGATERLTQAACSARTKLLKPPFFLSRAIQYIKVKRYTIITLPTDISMHVNFKTNSQIIKYLKYLAFYLQNTESSTLTIRIDYGKFFKEKLDLNDI